MNTLIKSSLRAFASVFLLAVLSIAFQSCKDDEEGTPAEESNVRLASSSLGNILVDANGNTLYYFTMDRNGVSNCSGGCLANWPAFHVATVNPGAGLSASDFGAITRDGGGQQTTYKGWPLYYFIGDTAPGQTNGQEVNDVWFVVTTSLATAPQPEEEEEEEEGDATILVANHATFGSILTDADGYPLYFFTNDADGTRHCNDGCLASWPIFHAGSVVLEAGSSLDMDDFGTIGEGANAQTTYKGWPLYYYAPDGEGEVNGDGVGNIWYVAKPDYGIMIADAQLVGHDGKNYTSDYEEGEGITKYFTDAYGRTLYIFTNDEENTNNYTEEDFNNNATWPIFHVDIESLPSALNAEDFGEIDVFGEPQLTFKGWPVYYFGDDTERGDNKGVSYPAAGVWPIINNATEVP